MRKIAHLSPHRRIAKWEGKEFIPLYEMVRFHLRRPIIPFPFIADLAQLGERLLDVEGVKGSSPLVSTILGVYAIMVVGYAVNVVAWVRFPLDSPINWRVAQLVRAIA